MYTRRQINLYRMFFADFSTDFHEILCGLFASLAKKLDHLACNAIQG